MLDVGRKRHVALFVEDVEDGTFKGEFEELSFAALHRHDGVAEKELRPGLGRLARAKHRDRMGFVGNALNQRFDGPARFLLAQKARLDDARVVGDEQVARAQKLFDVGEGAVLHHVAGDVQKTRSRPVFQRILSDELLRELEIKVG